MNTLYSGKQSLFEKLDKMMSGKAEEGEVSLLIDSLRVKFLDKKMRLIGLFSSDLVQVERKEQAL